MAMTLVDAPAVAGRELDKDNEMGEVRVTVRLTNAVDQVLVRRGQLAADQVRSLEIEALVDTGAVESVIPSAILTRLGLAARSRRVVSLADGSEIEVGVSEPIGFELEGRDTIEEAFICGDTVLVGQTVLEKTDLLVDCRNQRVIPNPAHPDGPVFRL